MFSFFNRFTSIEQQRLKALRQAKDTSLRAYLSCPLPPIEQTLLDTPILSLDFETTGLNAQKEKLLSFGCVEVIRGKIKLNTCAHQIINTEAKLQKQNVAIHQITEQEQQQGISLKAALDKLLLMMQGKAILVHYARIERDFIEQACMQVYGIIPPLMFIDTLAIIKKRMDVQNIPYDPSSLRLSALRDKYQLPLYPSHNALYDAISTAELLLAEVHTNKCGLNTALNELT